MANITEGWAWLYRGKRATIRRVTYKLIEHILITSPNDYQFDWPCEEQIRQAQDKIAS